MQEYEEFYKELLDIYKEKSILGSISGILGWDMEVYMPKEAIELRSEQQRLLSGILHDKNTNPRIGEILNTLEKTPENLDEIQKRNIFLIRREYNHATNLPKDFIQEMSKQRNLAYQSWLKAKTEKNFELFKNDLKKNIEMAKRYANYIESDKDPYNVMIDLFDPNLSYNEITVIFNELKPKLIELIRKIKNSNIAIDDQSLKQKIPIDKQRKLGDDVLKLLNFNLEKGRLDETEHPFTTGYINDVRLTTKYIENDFSMSLFSTMHEGGHGIYEQNLPEKYLYQPVSEAISSSVHESQSRFVENMIGRSFSFWEFYYPKLKEIFGEGSIPEIKEFYKAMNKVELSKIRISADEVTYCLHIILRFELERDIMDGKIDLDDLPQTWNDKIKQYFGLEIENDSEGVLQDVHWSSGLLGYFPSYALGNILSGQILHAMKKKFNFDEALKKGEVKEIIKWLNNNIHVHGAKYDLNELCQIATGEKLTSKYYIEYLYDKYSKIYDF